jgi:hypothetical protein
LASPNGRTILLDDAGGTQPETPTGAAPRGREGPVDRLRHVDIGGVIFGLVILGIGLYYVGQKTLGLAIPDLDWDRLWPLLVVGLGGSIVFSNWARGNRNNSNSSGPKAP